jgi:beta-galactosidase
MTISSLILFASVAGAPPKFTADETNFLFDGKPARLVSGELHYQRIPREYWRDRLRRAKAMGINAVSTYVFWNAHETEPGKFDFSGQEDVTEFVREAQEEGLWVILKPGPYICAEWEWGGLPWWLSRIPGMKLRSNNSAFLERVGKYFRALGERLAPFTLAKGGPILMCQVENEYGSFGDDRTYVTSIKELLRKGGFDCMLYTADRMSPKAIENGSAPETQVAINFGGAPKDEFANLAKFGFRGPKQAGNYWCGWFDQWGEKHHTTPPDQAVSDVHWMINHNVSMNLSMVHGGTNFGWMSGANSDGKSYEPVTTSYDYDAPIGEDGRLTPKYFALREEFSKSLPAGVQLPTPPADLPHVAIPSFTLKPMVPLTRFLGEREMYDVPHSFETLGQGFGFVSYRTRLRTGGTGELKIDNLQDRAIILVDGRRVGTLERRLGQSSLTVKAERNSTLEILMENLGRIDYSTAMLGEQKGISGATFLGKPILDWQMYPLDLTEPWRIAPESGILLDQPTIFKGTFNLDKLGDTFLDMTGWGHGNVWVNGHHLGRFWSIGPQMTLYLPAPWLRRGENVVTVLDTDPTTARTIRGVVDPIWAN